MARLDDGWRYRTGFGVCNIRRGSDTANTDSADADNARTEPPDGADSTDNADTSASSGRKRSKSLGKLHHSPIS